MYVCAISTLLAFTATSPTSEELWLTFSAPKMSKTKRLCPICYSWILYHRVHLYQLGVKHAHQCSGRFWWKVVRAISTLAGTATDQHWWHSERQGFQPPLRSWDQQEGCGLLKSWFACGSHSPSGTWQVEEWKGALRKVGDNSIISFATEESLSQGKYPGRQDSLYCQSIANSVKLTEVPTSLWRYWRVQGVPIMK